MTGNLTVVGLSRSVIRDRTWNFFMDAIVFAVLFASVYSIVAVARYWFSTPVAAVDISLSPAAIPRYAFFSLVRMIVAYLLSLVFAVAYGYFAAYNKRVEGPMLALLDILQSIPVLSFLPGVMLAMVSLFP
jgi:NitT/TauT family transport system permease protein